MIRIFTSKTQALGEQGETAAAKWLVAQGFHIVERNVTNKFGEIDIVARKGNVHYFFEVKTGRMSGWLNPAENLTSAKLRKFNISSEYYALAHDLREYYMRAIIVRLADSGDKTSIEMIDIA